MAQEHEEPASILCGTSNLELTIMPGSDLECGRPESQVTGML
jgi:hypothetical protein